MAYYKLVKDNKIIAFSDLPISSDDADSQKITEEEYLVLKRKQILKTEKLEKISVLKQKLSNTNSKILEYTEGLLSEEEFLAIKEQRKAIRNEINKLEQEVANE